MASNLPPEMIESILLRLPVKPLLRFKSVSKSWNSIISHRLFIRNHHHQANSKPQNLFLRLKNSDTLLKRDFSLVKLEDGKLQPIKIIETPLIDLPLGGDRLCFSEYGVILVTNDWHSERCLLWNPSTRTTTKISLPYGLYTYCYGICYDPAFDDFKVVAIYHVFYAVYSCKNKSWSNKKHPQHIASCQPLYKSSSGVSINGAIYWLLHRNINSRCVETIYYDPRDDSLKIWQKPKDLQGDEEGYLLVLGGHLCLFCYYHLRQMDKIQIWRKEKGIDENSWKELLTIHILDTPMWELGPLCFVGNTIIDSISGYSVSYIKHNQ